MSTREQKESPATLGHSVPLEGHSIMGRFRIPGVLQSSKEPAERLGVGAHILNPRDVFHEHDVRLAPTYEAEELEEQRHPLVLVRFGAGGILLGERLAGCASAEQHGVRPLPVDELADRIFVHLPNVLGHEGGRRKIPLEGSFGVSVPVEAEHHVHPGFLEAAAGPAATGEEIEHLHRVFAGGFAVGSGIGVLGS